MIFNKIRKSYINVHKSVEPIVYPFTPNLGAFCKMTEKL